MRQSTPTTRLVTVPANGQITIGKKWAGRQICIEDVDENRVLIYSGKFIPDHQKTFYTKEAEESLREFDAWSAKTPPKQTNLDALMSRVLKKKKNRDEKKK